jgi:glucokinase
MSAVYVGVDLGGTKVAVSVGDRAGTVIARTVRPTEPTGTPESDVARLSEDVARLVARAGSALSDVLAIGISAPGPLDPTGRRLLAPPNLPGWDDVPLASALEDRLGRPVRLENDANAAALAEWRHGAGQGFANAVYLTMSTGVGAGLILDGRLYRGSRGAAGELGHARVAWGEDAEPCSCGARGCLEAYVGGGAWARRLQKITPTSSAVRAHARNGEQITPVHVVLAARAGDEFALAELARFNDYLARGIVNLAFTLAPEVVILGTIPTAAGEDLCFTPVRQQVASNLWRTIADGLQIVPAALGKELPYLAGLVVATTPDT